MTLAQSSTYASSPARSQTASQAGDNGRDQQAGQDVNVGTAERWASAVGGGALAFCGLRARSGLGALGVVLGGALVYRAYTGHCSAYSALNINTADDGPAEPERYYEKGIHVEHAVTINKSPAECFRFWRNFENLPRFMYHLESVKVTDDKRSHWVVKAPAGRTVEWDAEIINEEPDALIAWRSLGSADVDNAGSVRFVEAPGDRGTEVRVVIDYIPPAGRLGKWVAALFLKNPEHQIREDLRRFKQVMEAGEVATSEGGPTGSCAKSRA